MKMIADKFYAIYLVLTKKWLRNDIFMAGATKINLKNLKT